MSPLPDVKIPLGWKQWKRVYLITGLAVALMLNRSEFPAWVLPEYRDWTGTAEASTPAPEEHAWPTYRQRIRLTGDEILVVGDSISRRCPPELADLISLWGSSTEEMRRCLEAKVPEGSYDTIVLWPGTSQVRQGYYRQYSEEVTGLLRSAQQRADTVILITPMPATRVPAFRSLEYFRTMMPTWVRFAEYALHRQLQDDEFADVRVYNARQFRSDAILAGTFHRSFEDLVHPTSRGMATILTEVDTLSSGAVSVPHLISQWPLVSTAPPATTPTSPAQG